MKVMLPQAHAERIIIGELGSFRLVKLKDDYALCRIADFVTDNGKFYAKVEQCEVLDEYKEQIINNFKSSDELITGMIAPTIPNKEEPLTKEEIEELNKLLYTCYMNMDKAPVKIDRKYGTGISIDDMNVANRMATAEE